MPVGLEVSRPSWQDYFIEIAKAVSRRGDCTRSQVGAVIVDPDTNVILATGFNGVKPGADGCLAGACPRGQLSYTEQPPGGSYSNCIARHAEDNALLWYMKNLQDRHKAGMHMYVSREPCDGCLRLLKGYRFSRVYYPGGIKFIAGDLVWDFS